MDAGWVAAIASVASAFVVGVAAIAALIQIRHIRNANEITTYLHLVDRLETANALEAFRSFRVFSGQLAADQSLRDRLAERGMVEEFREIETLLWYFDGLTMLIITGSTAERLVLYKYAHEIDQMWDALAEAVYLRRRAVPRFAATFEHLAMRAKTYIADGQIDRFYERLQRDPRMTGTSAP